jgi:membrane protease YdiL (CAAX protease family)
VWGFRLDNFVSAWRRCVYLVLPATMGAFLYGRLTGRLPLPDSFWLILLIYPVYGIAQQVALQVLVNRNVRSLIPPLVIRAGVIGLLFGAAHIPNWILVGSTGCAGIVFTWIYERHPNVLAIGVAHGFLGAAVYYLVLGVDPLAAWNAQPITL